MIPTLAIIILGLAWLAIETDWLRVRLLAGPALVMVVVPEYAETRAAWDTFDWSPMQFSSYSNGNGTIWKTPLCGWDWITSRDHIIPEYRIEFNVYGCRYVWKMGSTPEAAKILGECMKVNAKPHKPPKMPRLAIKRRPAIRRRRVAVAAA